MVRVLKGLGVVLVSLTLLAYVGYQIYQAVYNPFRTETVEGYHIYDTIDTEGLAFRKETVLKDKANGYISFTIANGDRVSNGQVVAHFYPTEADSRAGQQMQVIDREIQVLRDIESQGTVNKDKLSLLDKQLRQSMGSMVGDIYGASLDHMGQWRSALLEIINKRQYTVGRVTNFSERIAQLTAKRGEIKVSSAKATASVKAPSSGYFVDIADGYENAVPYDKVTELSSEKLRSLIDGAPESTDKTAGTSVGKIVGDFEWYLTCVLTAEQAGSLLEGSVYSVGMPFVTGKALPFTVEKVNRDSGGAVVVLKSQYMSGELSAIRLETIQIRINEFEGLRVPSKCIRSDEHGQKGVFILVGDTVAYRKVEILHSQPDFVICKEVFEKTGKVKDGYLAIYDQIIVEGKGLYDGKTIR